MKRHAALLLQVIAVLVGLGALAFLLWAPQVDGRNAQATTFEIYFKDPFVAYVYAASIPFFVGLHRAFNVLGHFRNQGACSQATVDALRAIRRCAFWTLGSVSGGLAFILSGEPEPPGIVMSFLIALVASLVAVGATMSARTLQKALRQAEDSRR